MSECQGKYMIFNGMPVKCADINPSRCYTPGSLYEVIRIINSVPLFIDDHIERLTQSTMLKNMRMLCEASAIKENIAYLIDRTGLKNGNIKVSFNYCPNDDYYMVYFIEALYPGSELYRDGVDTILYRAERLNPKAKVSNYLLRSQIYDKLVRSGSYEALLVNAAEEITEGSKSNMFFIRDNRVITAPDDHVLGGITRKNVIGLCAQLGIELCYRCLPVSELPVIDSLFLTGTSPHVLPIRKVDDIRYKTDNPVLRKLEKEYSVLVKEYMSEYRK